jgi:two-component system nitrogen regulation response regulator NtrX
VNKHRVLLVDDDKKVVFLLSDALQEKGYRVKTSIKGLDALNILKNEPIDAAILDVFMPDIDGIELLQKIKKMDSNIPVIMLSGQSGINEAVKAVKSGAYDFLEKPVSSDKVAITLENAIKAADLISDKEKLLQEVQDKFKMVGVSNQIDQVRTMIAKVASSSAPVLITGESGTGKELVARAIHLQSERASKPFLPVNCSAVPDDLFESELFGYMKGAFTGANEEKEGLYEKADEGTLFLDDISEMSPRIQPKLLRAIELGEIKRIGSNEYTEVDTRILASTNKDLSFEVQKKKFRRDLFYRIAVLTIKVPPLRERREDIPVLISYFMNKFCEEEKASSKKLAPDAREALIHYSWPGNVRELKNIIEKIVILSSKDYIEKKEVDFFLNQNTALNGEDQAQLDTQKSLEEGVGNAEKDILYAKLIASDWDYIKTASDLNISRATLFNKIRKYGIPGKRERGKV